MIGLSFLTGLSLLAAIFERRMSAVCFSLQMKTGLLTNVDTKPKRT